MSQFVEICGYRLGVGDSCFVRADGDPNNERPFIAKILSLQRDYQHGGFDVRVRWYYRPEDPGIPGGRRPFHGERELYLSDHTDMIHSATILGRCLVHSLDAYRELSMIRPFDYFSRFSFQVGPKTFSPENVTVYCICQQPENPDRPMVQCDACTDWFHPECCRTTLDQVEACSVWHCPTCKRKHAAEAQHTHAAAAQQQQHMQQGAHAWQAVPGLPAATAAAHGGFAASGLSDPLLGALQAQLLHPAPQQQQSGWL